MTDELTAKLADLIGPGGRLEVAFRLAVAAPPQPPKDRWQEVLNGLHDALGLATGLAAGHSTGPSSVPVPYDPQPCRKCGLNTITRIYGRPWHHICWQVVGCPVDSPPPSPAAVAPSTATATQPQKPSQSPAAPRAGGQTPQNPPQAGSGQTRRQNERPEPVRRFDLSDDDEMADWSREIRKRNPEATDAQCAAALRAWRECVQYSGDPVRFVSSAGYTGVAVYEWLIARRGGMPRPEPLTAEPVLGLIGARTTHTVLSFVDRDHPVTEGQAVTELDVNAQYLAAARSAELGDGDPDELGPVPADDHPALFKRPGYVQLGTRPNLDGLPVTARLPYARVDAGWWLPTPTARYLQHDHGVTLDIAAAWIWPGPRHEAGRKVPARHGRRLAVWCGLFADARAALAARKQAGDPAAAFALQVLKAVYAKFLGGMTRSEEHNDKSTLRPDWYDQYVTQAGANALRALDKTRAAGAAPMGLMKDSAWFVTDVAAAPYQPPGLEITDRDGQPGKWHINRWGLIGPDIVRAHKSGRIGTLRKAITAADNARTGRTSDEAPDSPEEQ